MRSEKYLYNVGIGKSMKRRLARYMTFLIIMAGLFMLILLEKPFEKRASGLIFLVSYLLLIAVYVVQTTFVKIVSNGLLMMMAVIVVCPLFFRLVQSSLRKHS
ncbi:hypothetical protein ACQ4LK_03460 [Bacillus pumilus]